MPEVDDFVHLHTHSDLSQLDGCGKISDYVKTAKLRGHRAIAFTDHGTMRGAMTLHYEAKEVDLKPVYGIEFYVARDMKRKGLTDEEKEDLSKGLKPVEAKAAIKDYEEREGIRDRWHITCWAKDNEGLRNLYRLSSAAFIDGFYYKPRIDLDTLVRHGEGLHVASGCLSSPINDSWVIGKRKQAVRFADQLHEAFGERFWLEVMPHAIADQREANKLMMKLRERYGGQSRLLATQDAHYVNQEDAEHHEVLLCIGTGSNLSDPDRFKFDGDEFFMKTRTQMRDTFRRHHEFMPDRLLKEALNSTVELAESCTARIETDYHAARLPDPGIPPKYKGDAYAYLKDLCLDGWAWREIPKRAKMYAAREGIPKRAALQTYIDRLKHEIRALKKQRFVPYFLLIRDIYGYARNEGIMVGPGRGSAGGSLVMYLLGITAVDPIEHGLIFERFISPFRIDLPDCDMDFEDRRRGEVIKYIHEKYGAERVCQIATIGKMSGKDCIRSVSRVLEVPLAEVNQVTSSIIERSSGDERASQTIEDSFKDFDVCRKFNEKYPKVLHHARRLEGMAKNLGIHAAGVVASPVPLTDLLPLEIRKHDGRDVVVSAWDMYGVAAAGLVKLDVLGLRTLTVIKEALEEIERRHGRKIDMENPADVDLNDPKVLDAFTAHDYGGVFQYDTPSADKVCQGVKFTSFEDIAAMTALNRPGTSRSGLATKYVERKKNPKLVEKVDFHPAVSKITADTLGIIVYQEHVIRIFTEIAGFAPGTSDALRKTIAKKIGDETLGRERAAFVEGAMKHTPGMTEAVANKIMDAITFFGSYGFNKSHATEYGMIAQWCMWLKVYYPMEFYWSLLKNEPDRIRIQQLAKDAKKHGIKLLPPHVNVSDTQFAIDADAGAIRGSLVDIKGVGTAAATSIMEHRPYSDLFDLLGRVDRRKCHKGVILALAKAGALEGLVPNTKWFVENADDFWKLATGKKGNEKAREALEASRALPDFDEEDKQLLSSSVNPIAFGKHPVDAYWPFIGAQVKVPIADMSHDDFFKDYDGKGCFIAGVIVEVKYNQIGDFHTGALPSEEERARQFWGSRYANVNVEDRGGKQNRTKFDIDIFDSYRHIIDKGIGTPVLVHASASAYTGTLRARFAVDLESFRKAVRNGEPLNVWERIVSGQHPAKTYPWKSPEARERAVKNTRFWGKKGGGRFVGVVTNVREKYDKKNNLMAFFCLIGGDGRSIEVICFASVWAVARRTVKVGRLVSMEIESKPDRSRGWSHFLNGGVLKWLRKGDGRESAAAKAAE